MSEVGQGPGWWQAADGRWYPPETLQSPMQNAEAAASSYPPPPWHQSSATGSPPPPMGLAIAQYCVTCGNGLVATAAICPRCGTPVADRTPSAPASGKSRTAAVLLAVFLSFWSFLYTYSISAWKFWLGLGLNVFGFLLAMVVDAANGPGTGIDFVWLLISLGVWIWSIVDRSTQPL